MRPAYVVLGLTLVVGCGHSAVFPSTQPGPLTRDIKPAIWRAWMASVPRYSVEPLTEVKDNVEFDAAIQRCVAGVEKVGCAPEGNHRWVVFAGWTLATRDSGTVTLRVFDAGRGATTIGAISSIWIFVRHHDGWVAMKEGTMSIDDYPIRRSP